MVRVAPATAPPTGLRPGQFFGDVVGKFVCAGATLSEVLHPKPRRVPEHSHQAAYFSVLLGGAYRETFGRHVVDYGLRSVSFHPPGTIHSGEMIRGARLFALELDSAWFERFRDLAPLPRSSHYRPGGHITWLAGRAHREFKHRDAASHLTIEGLLLEMLGELARGELREESGGPRWLGTAVDLLRAEFQRNLTLEEVARKAGVHPARLSRAFRREFRQTVGEYLKELRVTYALERITGDVDLSELALAAGFADQSHFTRVFRAHMGMTPGKFREQHRPRHNSR